MSDPRRLLDDPDATSGEKELLGSLAQPTPLTGAARSAIGARVTKSVAAPALAAKVLSLKAAGLFGGAVFAGGAVALSVAIFAPPAPSSAAPSPTNAERRAPALRTEPPRATPPVVVAPATPEAEPAPKAPAIAPRSTARRDTLALEESLLEQARRAIDSPARALSLLREHERRFPNGELTAERLYLTAQAHARAGNPAQARRYASALVQRFPKSTYVPRVRALLDEGSE